MTSGPLPRLDIRPAPVSIGQEQVLFMDRLAGVNAYNFQCTVRFHGRLDVAVLERALNTVIARHEVLRTEIHDLDGRLTQVVRPAYTYYLPVVDLTRVPAGERDAAADQLVQEEFRLPFDHRTLPLLRWKLLALGPDDHLLIHVEHHSIHDGWSLALLWKEIGELYTADVEGRAARLPDLPVQYSDVAVWQREQTSGPRWDRLAAFWRAQLADPPPPLDLPMARTRPLRQTFGGGAVRVRVPFDVYQRLRRFSRNEGGSLFMTLFAGYCALLHRLTGRTDLLVGTGMANRAHPVLEPLIGMLVNNVVVRTSVRPGMSFRELLGHVRDVALEAYDHQDMPFTEVVRLVNAPRDRRYNPLVQVLFSFHDSAMPELDWPGVTGRLVERNNGTAKFDLNMIAFPRAEQRGAAEPDPEHDWLDLYCEYNSDLFDEAAVSGLVHQLITLLSAAADDPTGQLSALPLDTAAVPAPRQAPHRANAAVVHELVAAQAKRAPDRIALVCGSERVSYGELNARANGLAVRLRDSGVRPEVPVGIMLDRSVDFVVAALAVLKAGGAYLPLDPAYPAARVAQLLDLAGAEVVVAREAMPGRTVVHPAGAGPEEDLDVRVHPDGLAYIMFTSGSTGEPKGVLVPHRGIVRLVRDADYARLGPDEVIAHLSSVAFDAATFEIWGALVNGARLVIGSARQPSLDDLGALLRDHGVTTAWLTAGLFHLMVDERLDDLRGLRQLLAGGDVLSPARVATLVRAVPGCRVVNGYGPTEGTTFTCCFPVPDDWASTRPVPIGRPISGTWVYLLDRELRAVPDGMTGELYAGGDGLARGYLANPELTAERFVPDPYSGIPGARLYATGDLARRLPDGTIEFAGRVDAQVKIRGFRVEPSEVEEAIRAHPLVRDVAVVGWGEGAENRRLVAYPVLGGADVATVRGWLRQRLPEHLVPDLWLPVDALPLTPGGKVDRGALPAPRAGDSGPADELSDEERVLAAIWAEVLEIAQVGRHDDFFDLGGHSLLAIKMTARVRDALGLELTLTAVFDHPTVALLAEFIRATG